MKTNTRRVYNPDPFINFGDMKENAYEHAEAINWKDFIREVGAQVRNVCIVLLVMGVLGVVIVAGVNEITRLEKRIIIIEKALK